VHTDEGRKLLESSTLRDMYQKFLKLALRLSRESETESRKFGIPDWFDQISTADIEAAIKGEYKPLRRQSCLSRLRNQNSRSRNSRKAGGSCVNNSQMHGDTSKMESGQFDPVPKFRKRILERDGAKFACRRSRAKSAP